MKILHFTNSLRAGGKERQLVELCKGLAQEKSITCKLATMSGDDHYNADSKLGIKIYYLIRKSRKDATILFKLYKLCKKVKPDIIHTWDSMTSVYAFLISKLVGSKFLNGMIRIVPPQLKLFSKNGIRAKLTFPFSDVVLSNSYAGLAAFNSPPQKSICIHNGFDFSRIEDLPDHKFVKVRFRIDTDKVVGMVASFSNYKDYETYISAAQIILEERDDVTFLAIGDGINLEKSKKMVSPQYKNKIKFLGKQQDVESIINIFNIGILSTNTKFHGEGISNSIMEYMALGKPVIATDSGGTREIISHGETGFLINSYDVNDMRKRIVQLLENEVIANKMGNAGFERIKREFSLEKMVSSYITLYESLLSSKPYEGCH